MIMKKSTQILIALFMLSSLNIYAQDTTKNNALKTSTYQVSLFHPIGTNGRASDKTSNDLSLNILSGYTGGLNGFELSFFSSVMNGNMKGCQISGFSNINTKTTKGVQIGLFSNINLGHTRGLQLSGFSNIVADSAEITQLSGFSNLVKGNFSGAQISGFGNFVIGNSKGIQISGFANIATKESKGTQIAGFINYAKVNSGLQLGFINIADSSDGVSIGFMSIIKHGYYKLSLYTDEMLMANLNYKMGSNKFYNIFGVSASQKMWGVTYGIGKHIRPEKKVSLNIDLSFTNMSFKKTFETQLCMKTKLSTDINFRINKKLDVFAGLSYNIFASDNVMDTELQNYVREIVNSIIQNKTFKSVKMQMWPGISIGLKYMI
jgi:hypothetical protein